MKKDTIFQKISWYIDRYFILFLVGWVFVLGISLLYEVGDNLTTLVLLGIIWFSVIARVFYNQLYLVHKEEAGKLKAEIDGVKEKMDGVHKETAKLLLRHQEKTTHDVLVGIDHKITLLDKFNTYGRDKE